MPTIPFERAVERRARAALAGFGADVRRLREDAGISRAELARGTGLDASYLAEIETGKANPSIGTCSRLALGLGADLPLRLYPSTGATIRDRHQAPIAEASIRTAHRRWVRFAEIAVRRPARGWIDLGFHDIGSALFVATEIQSDLRRLEQLVRWSEEKANSLPSWDGWAALGNPAISRLLIVRETRSNRTVAAQFRRLMRTTYPADPADALDSLVGTGAWPGSAILWAVSDGRGGYALAVRR